MDTLPVLRFWYTLTSLFLGVSVVTIILLLGREQHRRLALAYAGFLASIWIILLSFAIEDFYRLIAHPVDWPLPAMALNGIGSISYLLVAPFFYHSILGVPITPKFALPYRCIGGSTVAGIALIFIPTLRSGALIALNILLFAVIFYGIVMITLGFRRITERSLRRAIAVFVFLAALFFPLMFLESVPWLGERPLGGATNFALPTFYGMLSALSVPFAIRRLTSPPYLVKGSVTSHFATEFGISDREREVINKLCAGLSSRRIAEELFISPKTVENHLMNVFGKTGVHSRTQLVTLLYANQ